jgi:hypothetical protein
MRKATASRRDETGVVAGKTRNEVRKTPWKLDRNVEKIVAHVIRASREVKRTKLVHAVRSEVADEAQ